MHRHPDSPWAQLRFAVVGALLAAPPKHGELQQALAVLAAREWQHPIRHEPVRLARSTLERWCRRRAYAPVSPLAGFVNSANAGSTVPLKFNVTVNGAAKTDTTNLFFSTTQVASSACSASPQDPVDYVTVGETNLRYDTQEGQFVQSWRPPKTTGCVMARITYKDAEQEVVLVSAKFSLT